MWASEERVVRSPTEISWAHAEREANEVVSDGKDPKPRRLLMGRFDGLGIERSQP
jgi:hypothetical protein